MDRSQNNVVPFRPVWVKSTRKLQADAARRRKRQNGNAFAELRRLKRVRQIEEAPYDWGWD